MRMRNSIWILTLTVVLLMLTVGCGQETPNSKGEEDVNIRQAFLEQYVQDDTFTAADLSVRYVGKFDGFDAVYVDGVLGYTDAFDRETVDGVTFLYVTGQHLLIFSHANGRLYGLQEARDGGVLDKDGLQRVFEAHRAAEPLRYSENEDENETEGESDMGIDDLDVKRAYLEKYQIDPSKCTAKDLSVLSVGAFDGCRAVFVDGPFASATAVTSETAGGLKFVYKTARTVLLYRDGRLYRLAEAWEEGLIGRQALESLHDVLSDGSSPAQVK